ncbi:MAG: hypothetical protein [Microviridae sp.]|nr:MAG: hypothetical protein [Microviridae sp.]
MKKMEYYKLLADRNYFEVLDDTPIVVPIHLQGVETADQKMMRAIQHMISKNIQLQQEETDEESVNFDINDGLILTPHNNYVTREDLAYAKKVKQKAVLARKRAAAEDSSGGKSARTDVGGQPTGTTNATSEQGAAKPPSGQPK